MKKQLETLIAWYQRRDTKERIAIFLALGLVTYFFWGLLIDSSLLESRQRLLAQLEQTKAKIAYDQQQIALITLNLQKLSQQNALSGKADEYQQRLTMMIQQASTPTMFAKIIKDVLSKQDGVKLLSLKSIPAEPWVPEGTNAARFPGGVKNLFKHGMEMEFQSSYFETVNFLNRLEKLPWNFYWETLEYTTLEYPVASVKAKFYILSTQAR